MKNSIDAPYTAFQKGLMKNGTEWQFYDYQEYLAAIRRENRGLLTKDPHNYKIQSWVCKLVIV